MSDEPSLILPETCPHCGRPLTRLQWIARDVPEVKEFFVVDRPGRREGEKYPYPTYFDHDAPTLYETWREIVFACDECGAPLEGVTTDYFSVYPHVPALCAQERSDLIELLGYHLSERDGLPLAERARIKALQNRLVALNMVARGQVPDPDLFKPNGSQHAGIIDATYTSVWDGGVEVSSPCKYDADERRVFDIAGADVSGVESLEREYVILPDGTELDEDDDVSFDY
jgi:hypothetical protein